MDAFINDSLLFSYRYIHITSGGLCLFEWVGLIELKKNLKKTLTLSLRRATDCLYPAESC